MMHNTLTKIRVGLPLALVLLPAIAYATSETIKQGSNFGIIATDFVKVVERGTLPENASSVHAPLVYKGNDIYYMLYGGQPKPNIRDNNGAYNAYNRYIFAAKSTDGINWSDHRLLFAVPKGEQVLHGPCSIIKKGDKYYYWYDRWYQNHWATHLAVGHGENIYDCKWDFSPNMVFSSRMAQNNCSYSVAIHPKVLKKDNTYLMWITVYSHVDLWHGWVEQTSSVDGINWAPSVGVIPFDTFGGSTVYTPSWFQLNDKWFGLVLYRKEKRMPNTFPGLISCVGHPSEGKYSFAKFALPMGPSADNLGGQSVFVDSDGKVYIYYVVNESTNRCIYRVRLSKAKMFLQELKEETGLYNENE